MENEQSPSSIQKEDPAFSELPKMFIGGLSWQTAPEGLREYFSKFGDITEVMVMKDPTTRRSRGFGFVTFADPSSVDKVLTNGPHELDGKKIDPKIAFPKRAHPKMVTRTKKVFVGGLSAPTTLEDVKNYFQQFGRVSLSSVLFHFFLLPRFSLMLFYCTDANVLSVSPLFTAVVTSSSSSPSSLSTSSLSSSSSSHSS
jgi:RNA-binding protein Musashi